MPDATIVNRILARLRTFPVAFLLSSLTAAAGAAHAADSLVIVQPGYPGSTAEAREFVTRLCAAISDHGGPAVKSGEYHNDEAAGLEAAHKTKPAIGIVSLGVFLKYRKELQLEPLLSSRPEGTFRVLALKGAVKAMTDLKGKTVTGTPLLEIEFVDRVLFGPAARKTDSVAELWKLEPAKYSSRAIRNVVKGKADAVLLTDLEYRGARKLGSIDKLEVVHTTKAYPAAVVVALGKRLSAEAQAQLAKSLRALKGSEEGKDLLATMGLEDFSKVESKRLEELVEQYEQGDRDDKTARASRRIVP